MKIAHLILCHAHPQQVKRLVAQLSHKDAHFYIHVDKKAAIAPFSSIQHAANTHFIKKRVRIKWAGYSFIQAVINSFREILASGTKYDYINVLSGQDYPIKSAAAIHRFFTENRGKAFMHSLLVEHEWQEAIPRIRKYHLADASFPGRHRTERLLNAILPQRKLPGKLIPVGRSSWFTISPAHAQYIIDYLKKHPSLARFFKLSWGADEIIFQTILYNSPFAKDMVNDNLRYIDWSEKKPNPKILTMDDAHALRHSDKLFARKFSANDHKILDYLDSINS